MIYHVAAITTVGIGQQSPFTSHRTASHSTMQDQASSSQPQMPKGLSHSFSKYGHFCYQCKFRNAVCSAFTQPVKLVERPYLIINSSFALAMSTSQLVCTLLKMSLLPMMSYATKSHLYFRARPHASLCSQDWSISQAKTFLLLPSATLGAPLQNYLVL